MNRSFDFERVDGFFAGAVGEPGARVFYMQVRDGDTVVSLKAEKQQVQALARYLEKVAGDLPDEGLAAATHQPVDPVLVEWAIGSVMVAIDPERSRVVVVLEELPLDDPDDLDDLDPPAATLGGTGFDETDDDDESLARVRVSISAAQARAFASRALELVASGRPLCAFCGGPINPDGHHCLRMN